MVHMCNKCEKIFKRLIDLTRHENRKTPCYSFLRCVRCFKEFNLLGDFKRHNNRKILCDNTRAELSILLEIKQEERLIEQEKTKQAQEKTKQAKLKINKTNKLHATGGDINITFNLNVANIESLETHNMTIDEARDNFSYDMLSLVTNILKHQYNPIDIELKNNKCIKSINNSKFIIKTDNHSKHVNFVDIRELILNNFRKLIENTEGRFYPTQQRIDKRVGCLTEEIINIYKNSVDFTNNLRNIGLVGKALKKAVS
jgi:hypothetical protein